MFIWTEGVDQPVVVVPGNLMVKQKVCEVPVDGHIVGALQNGEVAGRSGYLITTRVPLCPDVKGLGTMPGNISTCQIIILYLNLSSLL